MTSFTYQARIAPLGVDISLPGEKVRPLVLDERTWLAWCEEPWHVGIRADHDYGDVGVCSILRVSQGWYVADFFLKDAIEQHLPEGLPIGQAVSVGFRTVGESIHLLSEISLVQKGAIRGAEIISRREVPRRVPKPATTAPAVTPKPRPAAAVTPAQSQPVPDDWWIEEARRWADSAPPGVIRRPGVGQVLAVGGVPVR